jgi:aminoglycoside phosphotransferase (APT) family kinase protein
MTDGSRPVEAAAADVRAFASAEGLTEVRSFADGVEFLIFRARSPEHGPVVLRLPRTHTFQTANNVGVRAGALLDQEYTLSRWLAVRGFPVAEALGIHTTPAGFPLLVSRFVESDDRPPDWSRVGELLARLHTAGTPDGLPALQYDLTLPELVARRLSERLGRLRALRPVIPDLPPADRMAGRLATEPAMPSLLHLDVRRQNLLCRNGTVAALVDWSNALVGAPRMELARVREYAFIEENELGEEAILRGYAATSALPRPDPVADLLFRLDSAVMLALVFLSVAPKPYLGPAQVRRVLALMEELSSRW